MNDPKHIPNDTHAMLAAYVDGELDVNDRRSVEELMENAPAYAQEVEELRALKRWLHDLPSPAPRRLFTLDPLTAPQPRRLVFPTLRWATAIAAVLLMLTVSADVIGSIGSGMGGAASTSVGEATSTSVASSASGSATADQAQSARSAGSAAASTASDAQNFAAQQAPQPSASAAAAASAPAFAAASSSAAASLSTSIEQSSGTGAAGVYPVPSASFAATTLVSAMPSASGLASIVPSTHGGASASIVTTPLLNNSGTTAPATVVVSTHAKPHATPWSTLRVAQLTLLIATVALGTAAWVARRQHL